jgi:hypothetical protein
MKTLLPFLILSFYLTGCATTWYPNIATLNQSISEVILSKANFKVVKFLSESHETTLFLGFGSRKTLVSQVRAKMFANAKMKGAQAIINEHVEFKTQIILPPLIFKIETTVSGTLIEFTE